MLAQIVLFDGFDLLDALAPYETFAAAGTLTEGDFTVELVTAEGARMVPCGVTGLEIQASGVLDPTRTGIVLVPGASGDVHGDGPNSVPAILARAAESGMTSLLRQAMEQPDMTVATVCGGALILAMAGLLEERYAVTHRLGMEVLRQAGSIPIPARVVQDGRLITGGGVTSGLDVALFVVEQALGPQIAHAVEQLFEYERRGTIWRPDGLKPRSAGIESYEHGAVPEISIGEPTMSNHLANFDGAWNVTISTPVGKQNVVFQISTQGGVINGTSTQGNDVAKFVNPSIQGNRMQWSMRVTKPLSLNLKFEAVVQGDSMTGVAKAGLLPPSRLEGTRILHFSKQN